MQKKSAKTYKKKPKMPEGASTPAAFPSPQGSTGHLVDFFRPAVVLNLKQPAEILPKKTKIGNNLS
jgi:hypothetical protein